MNVEEEYKKALKEIGPITPKPSKSEGLYIFSHPAYPVVDYLAETPEETTKGYKRILKQWIADRIAGNVADFVEKATPGRGGYRPNSGRKAHHGETITKRVPTDIVDILEWLKADPTNIFKVRKLMDKQTH